MAQCDWVVVCDTAITDTSGKTSLIGIFRQITSGKFPATHPVLSVGMRFSGPPNEAFKFQIRVWRPDAQPLLDAMGESRLDKHGVALLAFPFFQVPLPAEGEYRCEAWIRERGDAPRASVTFHAELGVRRSAAVRPSLPS